MASGAMIGNLSVLLSMDTAAFEKGATHAQKLMARTQRQFQQLGQKFQNVGRSMTRGLTLPIVAMGAASAKVFNDFQKGMSNVATLVDTSTESMDEMGRRVQDIAKRTPVAMGELTEALYQVRSAGITAGDAMNVLEGSARLAVAGLSTTAEATNLVTSAINAFNLKGEEQNRVYDVLFKAVKHGKTTIAELSQGFGSVAGTVARAGVQIDEFSAATAALTTTGLPAAEAQNRLRAAIVGLTRPKKELQGLMEKLGAKNLPDLIQKSGGLVNAFQRVREVYEGNEDGLLKLMGRVEGYSALMDITGANNEAFVRTLEDMRGGMSEVDKAFEKQAATSAAKWQKMMNQLQTAAIQIGEVVVPVLVKLGEWAGKAAEAFANLSPATQKVIVVMAAFVAAIGPVLIIIGKLISAFGVMLPLIVKLAPAFAALRVAMLAIFANPVILGAAAVITGIYLAWKNWDRIKEIVRGVYEAVKTWLVDKFGAIVENVKKKVDAVTNVFKNMYDRVVGNSYVPDMVDGIAYHFGRLQEEMVKPAQVAAAEIMRAFGDLGAQAIDDFSASIADVITGTKSMAQAFSDMAKQIIHDLIRMTMRMLIFRALSGVFGGAFATPAAAAPSVPNFVGPRFAKGGSGIFGGFSGVDKNLLSLNGTPIARVSKGEQFNVTPANDRGSGDVTIHQHYKFEGVAITEQQFVHGLQLTKHDTIATIKDMNRR